MSWAKFDDEYDDNPKCRAAGKDGRALDQAGIRYCAKHRTDGVIPDHDLPLLAAKAEVVAKRTIRKLVDVGRWHEHGHDCERCAERVDCPPGHVVVHDYLDYNPTAQAAEAKRQARAEAGRKGGQRSRPRSKPEANSEAIASATEEQNSKLNGTPSPYPPDLHPPPTNGGTRPEPAEGQGGGLVDEAVQLAARRYGRNQVDQGRGASVDGLANWWTQENAESAKVRAAELLASYKLTATQLADALLEPSPRWLEACRRRNGEHVEQLDPDALASLAAAARSALEQPWGAS